MNRCFIQNIHAPSTSHQTSPIYKNYLVFSDSVVTVLLAEWDLTCDYFDGDWLNGPVPHLFALDPAVAKAAIDIDPNKAFKDISGSTPP